MGRKERRAMERKIKHLAKTKPHELQTLIRDTYGRDVVESRMNNEVLAPGDKVMLNLEKIAKDPEYDGLKPEYKAFIKEHANEVFTLSREARSEGPFDLVSFNEDTTDPKWLFFVGHVKKVHRNDGE